jgi:hypothetical protein
VRSVHRKPGVDRRVAVAMRFKSRHLFFATDCRKSLVSHQTYYVTELFCLSCVFSNLQDDSVGFFYWSSRQLLLCKNAALRFGINLRHNTLSLHILISNLLFIYCVVSTVTNYIYNLRLHHCSSVSIVTRLRAGPPGFKSRQGQGFFPSTPRPDRPFDSPSLLSNSYRECFPQG